jgi:outer membrane receptor for ferrienterochelin and colicin
MAVKYRCNRNLRYIYLLFFVAFTGIVHAQSNLSGTIYDERTNEPLAGATVSVKGTTLATLTNDKGYFELKYSGTFPVTLSFTYLGYTSSEQVIKAAPKKLLSIRMTEQVSTLKEVKVTTARITEKQQQSPITVETMDIVSIKETPSANFYEGLALLKGVDLTSASIGFKIINTRGFNSTSPVRTLQMIDGVDNQAPGLNFSLGNFLGASELDIQKVDLVVGASSAYYGPNAFNGVIHMQTKSPFLFPGLSAQVKVGERNLLETAVRWAQKFKNKKGDERFAYKFNMFYMRANDWNATNYSPTEQSPVDITNPGGYDAVNRYGDEYINRIFYTPLTNVPSAGQGYYLRDGYKEKDLVDYNSHNLKLSSAFHYKFKKDHEVIYSNNFGTGTTVYQGDNRFSLKNILFLQNRLEVRKEGKYFIRAYATHEDAGESYDAYATALILQNSAKSDLDWGKDYNNYLTQSLGNRLISWYSENINGNGLRLDTIPAANNQRINYIENYWRTVYKDSLVYYHTRGRQFANSGNAIGTTYDRFEPGTARFDSAFKAITTRTNRNGGSRLFDRSALYHVVGEYRFKWQQTEFITGANYRLYTPNSRGTIFLDTAANQRIRNSEFGAYLGVERKVMKDQLKLSLTNRIDKNQNFNWLWSPAATAVFTKKQHVLRVSVSSALRNPTLTDQYINLNVGRATLLGNLNGFDSLVPYGSLIDAFNNGRQNLRYFNVDKVKPEQVRTIEMGYRTIIKEKLFLDISYYHSWYTNFLGFIIGAHVDWPPSELIVKKVQFYRITSNSKDEVTTQGATVGATWFIRDYFNFSGNYSYNELNMQGSRDSLIPAFNTPKHKFNVGINGREINTKIGTWRLRNWGYNINYKWQEGFEFEGSPQFTGFVPAYAMVDAQVNKRVPSWYATFKLGANNLLNNRVYQVYGGPLVGRLVYFSVLFELDKWK